MRVTAMRTLGISLATVGALAAGVSPAGAFPDGTRTLVRSAVDGRCVTIESAPNASGTAPMRLALTDRCDAADPAQRWHFDWDTLRSDAAPGLCVAPSRGVLVLEPCDESDRSQLWVSRPRRANAEHIEAAEGENLSWTATASGAVRLEPTRDDAVQEWRYLPVT